MKVGGVEGGGTKFVCAVLDDASGAIEGRATVETTSPEETLARVAAFFAPHGVAALGVATFGPLDLAAGATLATPKPGWSHVAVREPLARALSVPVVVETDVNAAAIAEAEAHGVAHLAYVTVGTGVGVGCVLDGVPVHGAMHPELGHLAVAREPGDDFAGACPFHGACVEGLASAPAIRARTGREPATLRSDDPVWALVGDALAQLVVATALAYAPERIVLGGGVLHAPGLRERVRQRVRERVAGYLPFAATGADVDALVVAPRLGDDAGITGALHLAVALAAGLAGK